jgi:NADH:ubiquinone oxidoreductase subunit 4 (subunit M)
MIFLMMHHMFKLILVVRNQITNLIFNHFWAITPSSQPQMENVNSISIFIIQGHSNGILGPQFGPHLLLTCFCLKDLGFLRSYNFQNVSQLEMFGIHFLALSHICGNVFESQDILLAYFFFHASCLVTSLRLGCDDGKLHEFVFTHH